jgi:2-polyprenyl-3-methyl-5-hydroxy-6-metoxy-1,4-benzoquinol methylase
MEKDEHGTMITKSTNLIKRILGLKSKPDFSRGARTVDDNEYFWGDKQMVNHYLDKGRLAFFREVSRKLPKIRAKQKVMDVGCGTGHVLKYYTSLHRIPEENVVANDITLNALILVNEQLPRACLLKVDVLLLHKLISTKFDLLIITEVIEHLEDPKKYLSVLINLLQPGGRLAITIPDGATDHWVGHTNFWTLDEFKEFLGLFKNLQVKVADRLSSGDLFFVAQRVSSK